MLGIYNIHQSSVQSAKQERIYPPQTGPGIFGSAADSFSGRDIFCAKCHQNWVKDYLQGVQLFTTHSVRTYHNTTVPAGWCHGRCTTCPLVSSAAFNIHSRHERLQAALQFPATRTCVRIVKAKGLCANEKLTVRLFARWAGSWRTWWICCVGTPRVSRWRWRNAHRARSRRPLLCLRTWDGSRWLCR